MTHNATGGRGSNSLAYGWGLFGYCVSGLHRFKPCAFTTGFGSLSA